MENVTLAAYLEGHKTGYDLLKWLSGAGLVYFNFMYKNKYVKLGRETLGLSLWDTETY